MGGLVISGLAYRQVFPRKPHSKSCTFDAIAWHKNEGRSRQGMAWDVVHHLRQGATRESVLAALGEPDSVTPRGAWRYHVWSGQGSGQELHLEFNVWNRVAFASVATVCYMVPSGEQVMMGHAAAIGAPPNKALKLTKGS